MFNKSINIDYKNYKYINKFREKSLEERLQTSNTIKLKYNNRIPIIVDCDSSLTLFKNKYIVPNDLTMAQFIYILKKKIKMTENQSIFIICNNKLINSCDNIGYIYDKENSADGFLYLIVSLENVFG
tara:strand:- start:198 stop:578 length:381 start_codon:yes stop_codon:yes gene_type:complete